MNILDQSGPMSVWYSCRCNDDRALVISTESQGVSIPLDLNGFSVFKFGYDWVAFSLSLFSSELPKMSSMSNQSIPVSPLNDYSDRQLLTMALASTRPLDEGMVVQDSELWGYLQPVFDTSSDPYIDFPKCDVMHYRWSVAPLDGASNHVIEFTRAANDQPTVLRNLSGAMVIAVSLLSGLLYGKA